MKKDLLKLVGAQELSADEQKTITGGNAPVCNEGSIAKRCTEFGTVPAFWDCVPFGTKAC